MNTKHLAVALAFSALAAAACSKSETKPTPTTNREPEPSSVTTPSNAKVDMDKAQSIFNERCSACHGTDGKGSGPAAAALNPKPRNYTDKAWQSSVTDEQLKKTIVMGGAAVGKSPIMPASPDLDDKPEVVEGLVKLVRKFGN